MFIVYLGLILILFILFILTMRYLTKSHVDQSIESVRPLSSSTVSNWDTTTVTTMSDMFTMQNNWPADLEKWDVIVVDENIQRRDDFIEDFTRDLAMIEAYHPDILLSQLIVYAAVYILYNKTHYSVCDQQIHTAREFDFIKTTRTVDQARDIIDTLDCEATRLTRLLIERRLATYSALEFETYEILMVNIYDELIRQAKGLQ